ncbi:hypothetical protein BJ138DRAFT_422928 [Hygrophoropsis aurantiaca]|uniref:Uncharacterized protein n=1 Tax=Hygrophoropsis aurantiaca TaxID=72124 RepID=A0ACB8A4D8_9AGAM|nr:hypothetical protein BJ138DRAFT_422928 [Hygrophoropsis aurantiaca]
MLFSLDPRPERNTGIVLQLRRVATGNTVLRRFVTTSQVDDAVAKFSKKFEDQFREFDKALAELNANRGTSNFDSLREDDEDEDEDDEEDEDEEEASQVPVSSKKTNENGDGIGGAESAAPRDYQLAELQLQVRELQYQEQRSQQRAQELRRQQRETQRQLQELQRRVCIHDKELAQVSRGLFSASWIQTRVALTERFFPPAQQGCGLHPVTAAYALTGPAAHARRWMRPT